MDTSKIKINLSKKTTIFSKKNNDVINSSITDEFKESNSKYTLSKFERDLYYEEDNIIEKIIRIRRYPSSTNKEEKWKLFEDNKVMLTIESEELTKKEKKFLRSVEGVVFLIKKYKLGLNSSDLLIKEIKNNIST